MFRATLRSLTSCYLVTKTFQMRFLIFNVVLPKVRIRFKATDFDTDCCQTRHRWIRGSCEGDAVGRQLAWRLAWRPDWAETNWKWRETGSNFRYLHSNLVCKLQWRRPSCPVMVVDLCVALQRLSDACSKHPVWLLHAGTPKTQTSSCWRLVVIEMLSEVESQRLPTRRRIIQVMVTNPACVRSSYRGGQLISRSFNEFTFFTAICVNKNCVSLWSELVSSDMFFISGGVSPWLVPRQTNWAFV